MQNDIRLRFYYQHVLSQTYSEPASDMHRDLTHDVIQRFIQPLGLAPDAQIQDLGSGQGYFLDRMRELGYTNVQGVTLSVEDCNAARSRGHRVRHGDMNFLPERDESQDLLFCRHSLEHSPFPYITLLEYNRVLRPRAWLYVEVPRPDADRPQENNRNHYSVLGRNMWLSLLYRSGFDIDWHEYEVPVTLASGETQREQSMIFVCQRRRPVDIK